MSENLFLPHAENPASPFTMAVVHAVHPDGLQLTFQGEAEPSGMHYKMLQGAPVAQLDRVLCLRISGTHLVLGAVGNPSSPYHHGDKISFFGQPPVARATGVSSVASNASLSTVVKQFNNLVAALDHRGYGLIV